MTRLPHRSPGKTSQSQFRRNSCLQRSTSHKHPKRIYLRACLVRAYCSTVRTQSPEGTFVHRDTHHSHNVKATDEVGGNGSPGHLSEVEQRNNPGKALSGEMQVRVHTEHGRIIDRLLVKICSSLSNLPRNVKADLVLHWKKSTIIIVGITTRSIFQRTRRSSSAVMKYSAEPSRAVISAGGTSLFSSFEGILSIVSGLLIQLA